MTQDDTLQLWKLAIVCLLQKHNGLLRITHDQLRAYQSDQYQIGCKVVSDEQAVDVFLVTPEEAAQWR